MRFAHIRHRPAVSATHTVGETLAVTVHGTARVVDLADPSRAGFRSCCTEIYPDFEEWGPSALSARIEADRMFAFVMDPAV